MDTYDTTDVHDSHAKGKKMSALDNLTASILGKAAPATTGAALTADDTSSRLAEIDADTSRDSIFAPNYDDTDAHDAFHARVLTSMGIDPDEYAVSGNVKAWKSGDDTLFSASIVRKDVFIDSNDIIEKILSLEPTFVDVPESSKRDSTTEGAVWATIQVGDIHIGKSAHDGGGTSLIVERTLSSISRAIDETPADAAGIHIAVMGDIIEGESSQGGKNVPLNDLPLTSQLRIAVALFTRIVRDAVAKTGNVVVSVVPGNHGDVSRQFSRPATENFDIFVMSQVQSILETVDDVRGSSTFSDAVKWVFPQENSMHVTYPVGDTIFTSVHGHRFGRGAGIIGKAKTWWEGHVFSGGAEAQSQVMMMGHYHTASVQAVSHDRMIICSPALEDKSTWFHESSGVVGMPGVMVYLTDERRRPYNISIC